MISRYKKRSQIAIEFTILVSMAAIILVLFLSFLSRVSNDRHESQSRETFIDLGMSIQRELVLAASVESGYTRVLNIPSPEFTSSLNKYTWDIEDNNTQLNIFYNEGEVWVRIPEHTGKLSRGQNIVKNVDGQVIVE